MTPFKITKILIPIDFSESASIAIEHASFMARLCRADVTLLHVVETHIYQINIPGYHFGKTDPKMLDSINKQMEVYAENMQKNYGISPKVVVKTGKVAAQIIQTAKETKADMIVLGTHGTSGIEEFFIGNNTFRVTTDAPCPVLSVQTHSTKLGFDHIVLPIDSTPTSRQKVRYAAEIAKSYGSTIHVLNEVSNHDRTTEHKFKIITDQVSEYLNKHDVIHHTQSVHGDNLAKLTMNYANEIKADLIMIMTEQEDNLTGLLLGPYAQQIVNHSKIPVMSIRPEVNVNLIGSKY
jgi:nucleotide-binding universal stress UspA family protein